MKCFLTNYPLSPTTKKNPQPLTNFPPFFLYSNYLYILEDDYQNKPKVSVLETYFLRQVILTRVVF
jgi:hypothetical protein